MSDAFADHYCMDTSTNEHIVANGDIKATLKDHDHTVECIAWAPDSAANSINEASDDVRQTMTLITY